MQGYTLPTGVATVVFLVQGNVRAPLARLDQRPIVVGILAWFMPTANHLRNVIRTARSLE